jgi:hypothetical protein
VTISRTRRLGLAVAAAVLVVGAITGCSSATNSTASGNGLDGAPKVGSCWTTTFSSSQEAEDWVGSPAVGCTDPHQSYTFAVAKLNKTFGYTSWLTSSNDVRQDVDQDAYAVCRTQQRKELPGVTEKEALLYPTYYLPSVQLWERGARWVRCDITQVKVGSTVAHPQLANLESFTLLKSTLASDPKKFALCEDDPANNGPDGAQTTYADCTGSADWTFLAAFTMAGTDGTSYPGVTQLKATGATQCAVLSTPAGHVVYAEPPSEADWTQYNDRELDCWLNNN